MNELGSIRYRTRDIQPFLRDTADRHGTGCLVVTIGALGYVRLERSAFILSAFPKEKKRIDTPTLPAEDLQPDILVTVGHSRLLRAWTSRC